MSQRLAALQALYDEGQNNDRDLSLDQSLTTYPRANTSLGLDSSASVDLLPPPQQNLLSSTEDEKESNTSDIADDTDQTHETETVPTPKRPSTTSASATPRTATTRSSLYNTPAHMDESGMNDESSSISTSLRASHLAQSRDALQVLDEEEGEGDTDLNASRSGHWGVQEMRRRTEAGISIKSTLQKIEQLTAERDDLKIEVDFHRRNMSPEDVGAEVISLRQEKLSYVRRLQKLNELLKSQDQALKTVNRQVRQWEAKLADHEQLQEQLRQAEARAAQGTQDTNASEEIERLEAALRTERDERLALQAHVDALRETATDAAPSSAEELRYGDSSRTEDVSALQQQLDEQHELICELQDALAAERLVVAEKDGEMDRLEAALDEAEAATNELQTQLHEQEASHAAAHSEVQHLQNQVQQLTGELSEAHRHHEGVEAALHEQCVATQAELGDAQARMEHLAAQHADLEDLNARLNDKLLQLVRDLKEEEQAREQVDLDWSQRYDSSEAHLRHSLVAKDALIDSLQQQVAQARDEAQRHDKACQRLQEQRRTYEEQAQRTLADVQTQHRHDMERLRRELEERWQLWQEAQDDVVRLQAESNEMTSALQAESRLRMQTQERLESTQRALDQARHEAERASASAAESARRDASSSARSLDASLRPQMAERNLLLATVYDGLVRALGEEVVPGEARLVHTHFAQFHDKVTQRLRRLAAIQTHFAQRADALEKDHTAKLADVRRLQESRWSHVERIEKSIRAATEKQQQWRRRLLEKDYELTELQRANRELEQQVARLRDTPMATPTPATPAQLSVRLRELERRCKEADERVKRERAGAKERATRDEARIRAVPPPTPAVWGRTQYTMLDHHAHASPAMKRDGLIHTQPAAPPSGPPAMAPPAAGRTPLDLLACFHFPESAPQEAHLRPTFVKGYGRLALHRDVVCAGLSSPPLTAPAPVEAPRERSERLHLVAHWLAADDDLDDDMQSAGARVNVASTYHPMVAKGLREQSRRAAARPSSGSAQHDWWIAPDGTRCPRGALSCAGRRRMVSTMHSLAASGITPSMACRCGFTDDHMDMVQCDGCARWLHLACAGVSHADQLPHADWMCDDCYEQRTAMSQPRLVNSAAFHAGLHAHARLRSSTLSLAPSPKRSLEDQPLLSEHDASTKRVSVSSDNTRPLCRTPSPPPSLQLIGTPSRHFTPFAHAEWLPTPTHFLAHTPYNGIRTPSQTVRALGPLDSPTNATRRAQCLATPRSQASPSVHSDPVPSSVALSSPMPVTPTGPTRDRMLAMPLGSPHTPKTATIPPMPLAWAWE
ncbi:hypothetical protein MNAN1_002899 [Malassezia nana]|uniref:Zinc finger PHD-type domain-containing protein n=1 Tax=Malassezia nana TaxID=180528 RepID=A0AAF0J390_9BASI|nr:hypothetical protein MNAN1_002899 [Malassezia nana]